MNKKSVKISNELGQRLLGVQIYPKFSQNNESDLSQEDPKELVAK